MEDVRATWGWTWLESIFADIRYSLRALGRQPAFVAVAVLSLALAIGANSAIFSFADALLLRPLPIRNPSACVRRQQHHAGQLHWRACRFRITAICAATSRSFSGLAAYRLTTVASPPIPRRRPRFNSPDLVSDNFFPVVGVTASPGRVFSPGETTASAQPVAMISYDFWQQNYAGDHSAIGGSLRLNGIVFTIIGVTPESFTGLDRFARPSIFVPLGMGQRLSGAPMDPLEDRARHNLVVKGRLSAGASRESAQAELAALGAALEREYPKTNRNLRVTVRTELERRVLESRRNCSRSSKC